MDNFLTEEEVAKIAYAKIIQAILDLDKYEKNEEYYHGIGFPSSVCVNGTTYRFERINHSGVI